MSRRRVFVALALIGLLSFSLHATAEAHEGTSVYDNVAPASQTDGKASRYPVSRYGLDYHVEAGVDSPDVKLPWSDVIPGPDPLESIINNVPTGIGISDAPDLLAHKLAAWIWQGYLIISSLVLMLFEFAWSMDILTGSGGILRPITSAMNRLYDLLGGDLLALVVGCLGFWIAMQMNAGRHGHTTAQVLKSIVFAIIAMAIIWQPVWAVGGALRFSNEFGNGILAAVTPGGADAKTTATDALHQTMIKDPWVVANFGGIVHCANPNLMPSDRACSPKMKIDNRERYADRWLAAGPANGKARTLWYDALKEGKVPSHKAIDDAGLPSDAFDGVKLGAGDKSAVDIQQAPSAGDRLAFVAVMFLPMLGSWLVVGSLSIGVIIAQAIVAFFLIGAPFALLAALIPGPGHRAFHAWGWRMLLLCSARPGTASSSPPRSPSRAR